MLPRVGGRRPFHARAIQSPAKRSRPPKRQIQTSSSSSSVVLHKNENTTTMVLFGDQQLKNQLEEAREERDFFQTKYQEQMAELTAMRKALQASQREISRLRKEIIVGSPLSSKARTHHSEDEEKKEEDESFDENDTRLVRIQSVTSGITEASEIDDEVDLDENAAIRESASKLLQWVDHRVSSQIH